MKCLCCCHTCFRVDLLQSCRDYLSRQGTNAETVWNNLISRVHPVNFASFSPQIRLTVFHFSHNLNSLLTWGQPSNVCHVLSHCKPGSLPKCPFFQPASSNTDDLSATEAHQSSYEESAQNNSGRTASPLCGWPSCNIVDLKMKMKILYTNVPN